MSFKSILCSSLLPVFMLSQANHVLTPSLYLTYTHELEINLLIAF